MTQKQHIVLIRNSADIIHGIIAIYYNILYIYIFTYYIFVHINIRSKGLYDYMGYDSYDIKGQKSHILVAQRVGSPINWAKVRMKKIEIPMAQLYS